MEARRLGCISASGMLAALATLLVIAGVGFAQGGVLFSPGELSQQNAHQPLGGVYSHSDIGGNCASCHVNPLSMQKMADRCLLCHFGIMGSGTLHASLLSDGQTECRDCHPEHRGPQAELTLLDPQNFPHEKVGYSLVGHQQMPDGKPFSCENCHHQDIRSFDQEACELCHRDIQPEFMQLHTNDFGQDCLACHDGIDRYGSEFDHSNLSFPLSGQHLNLACTNCHAGARTPADLRDAPQDCFACHRNEDPHAGQFGQDCAGCHTTEDWSNATFDHSLAAFQLTGAHLQVSCRECHLPGANGLTFKGTPQECQACHNEPEYHLGLFSRNCDACHTAQAWSPAIFEELHIFPMNHGENGLSQCQVCHPDQLQNYTCYGCHEHNPIEIEEEHREEGITNFNDCMRCHPTGQEEEGEHNGDD
jgi:hypothetical protein